MIIRFLPSALGIALGQIIGQLAYIFIRAFAGGAEQYIPWSYELIKALCVGLCTGFITASAMVIVMAILETKRIGNARVKLW